MPRRRPRRSSTREQVALLVTGGVVGATLEHVVGSRLGVLARGPSRARGALAAVSSVAGRLRGDDPVTDDETLASRVETELSRSPAVPEGQIDVNVEDGIVQLRGEAPTPEVIRSLGWQAVDVPGVQGVENLLHVPYTPPDEQS
jgi:osmotically-inducible protein OsmY